MSAALAEDQSWKTTAERGSVLGIRFVIWLTTTIGRAPTRLLVRGIAFYYTLFSRKAREGARVYLEKVLDEKVSFRHVHRQILRFSQMGLDALFFLTGKTHYFEVRRTGHEHLASLVERGQGAVLLGAHHGSMYAMRAKSGQAQLPLRAVVYTKHAERVNEIFRQLNPDSHARLIQMSEGVDFMLKIREEVEKGSIIALLGDRVGSDERAVEVDFLGEKARFPSGPYMLASMLKCPVYLTFGIYRDPNVYELFCEPFADRIELPRGDRKAALEGYVQRYAERLEHYCRMAPDNWFNFYDFWRSAADAS